MSAKTRRKVQAERADQPIREKQPPADWLTTARLVGLILLVSAVLLVFWTASEDQAKIKTTVFYIGVAVLGAIWIIPALISGEIRLVRSRVTLPALAILVFSGISLLLFPYKTIIWSEFARRAAYVLLYFLVLSSIVDRRHLRWFALSALVTAVPIVVYGFSHHFGHDLLGQRWSAEANVQLRIISTMGNATYLAAYLAVLIPAAVAYLLLAGNRFSAVFAALVIGGAQIALMWTWSRGPWASLAVGLLLCLGLLVFVFRDRARRYGSRLAVAAAVLLIATAIGSYKTDVVERAKSATASDLSNIQRACQWRAAYAVFKERPVLGAGVGATSIYVVPHLTPAFYATSRDVISGHAHNEFLEILAEGGIVQGLLFLWLMLELGVLAIGTAKRAGSRDDREVAVASIALFGAIVAFLLANIGGLTMRCTYGGMLFWLMVGLLVVCGRLFTDTYPNEPAYLPRAVNLRIPLKPVVRDSLIPPALALAVIVSFYSWSFLKAEVLMKKASYYMGKPDWVSAEVEIRDSLRYNKYSMLAHYKLANCLAAQGSYKESLEACKKVMRLFPDYGRIHAYTASVLRNLRDYDAALAEVHKAIEIDGLPGSYAELSHIQEDQGQHEQALATLRKAFTILKDAPAGDDRLWASDGGRLVGLQFVVHPDLDPIEALREIIPSDSRSAPIHVAAGDLFRKNEDWIRAEREYNAAIEADPGRVATYDVLGFVLFQQEKFAQALSSYQTLERLTAREPRLQKQRLNALLNAFRTSLAMNDRQTAGALYSKMVELAPESQQTLDAKQLFYEYQ